MVTERKVRYLSLSSLWGARCRTRTLEMQNGAPSDAAPHGMAVVSAKSVSTHRLPEELVSSGPKRSIPTISKGVEGQKIGCMPPGDGSDERFAVDIEYTIGYAC